MDVCAEWMQTRVSSTRLFVSLHGVGIVTDKMTYETCERCKALSDELLSRAIDAIGRFTSDEDWTDADMDTLDSLIAATEVK